MASDLFDFRFGTRDGSRHFADLPVSVPFSVLRDHLVGLPGAKLTGYLTDHVSEVWIDFEFRGHRFTVNSQMSEFWFFVDDPACPDATLTEVVDYAACLLGRR